MPLKVAFCKHTLNFKFDAGTSRGILKTRDSFFIKLYDSEYPKVFGIGEAAPLKGLSIDFKPEFESYLTVFVEKFNLNNITESEVLESIYSATFDAWPSIRFAFEMALLDLKLGGRRLLFDNNFGRKNGEIDINGLIWMGDETFMSKQIVEKLRLGFKTLKMKIGAIDFDTEINLLQAIRGKFREEELSLRVDANGAFDLSQAKDVIKQLSKLQIHSIEQPIKANQWELMAELCFETAVPIALDEELIGILGKKRASVLDVIKPQFIICKPTLLGGFHDTDNWIKLAEERNIGWWITSALESNVGLNAIAQYTYGKNSLLPQGLGTGQLFENNIKSPLSIENGSLSLKGIDSWDLTSLIFNG